MRACRFYAIVCLCSILYIPSVTAQVTSNVLRRTLLIQASETGTAFTIDIDGRQYIITAKHIVKGLPSDTQSTIQIGRKAIGHLLRCGCISVKTLLTSPF